LLLRHKSKIKMDPSVRWDDGKKRVGFSRFPIPHSPFPP